MFKLTSNYLTKIPSNYAAHLTRVDVGNTNYATLATIGFSNQETTVLANTYGTELEVPETWSDISVVSANGQLLALAADPQNPQQNEYVFNPYTKKIIVYSYSPSIVISGSLQTVQFSPKLVTNLPSLFSLLPIEGQITFERSFENHPTGQFAFETSFTRDQVYSIFVPGRELELFGIGFRVNVPSCTELSRATYPGGRVKVSLSLGGKWENNINQPCFLRSDGKNTIPSNIPFTDPECLTGNINSSDPNKSISINTLFSRIGIVLTGANLKNVPVPDGTLQDEVANPSQLLEERLRVANSFVRYSDFDSVKVLPINALASHTILESDIISDIESTYEGISKPNKQPLTAQSFNPNVPDLTNFASTITTPTPVLTSESEKALSFEYPNSELTGDFSEPKEKKENTQGDTPRYIRKSTDKIERIEGDPNAHIFPDGVASVKVMSLCFDLGGEQKTRTYITEEDNVITRTIEEIWGFAFTYEDIYNISTGKTGGNPADYWKLLKKVTTTFNYDVFGDTGTGFLFSKTGTGFNTVRWKSENVSNPETQGFIGEDTTPELTKERELYTFFTIPIIERYSRTLKVHPDASYDDAYELVKNCNQDGTSSFKPVFNPIFLPAYYVEHERSEKISFKSRSNPENEGLDIQANDVFAPDLYVGSMELSESKITGIVPAKYEQKLIKFEGGYPVYQRGRELEPQKWYKYNYKFSASGQNIATAVEEAFTENGTGALPEAGERMIRYIKEDPAPDPEDNKETTEPVYKYLIQTEGYTEEDIINGSESFSIAETLEEALTAAKCKLAIENWRNGYSENLSINFRPEIKEGDIVKYFCNGQLRKRVAINVSHELNILGNIDGQPIVEGQTRLSLGLHRLPILTSSKIKLPGTKSDDNIVKATIKPVNENFVIC